MSSTQQAGKVRASLQKGQKEDIRHAKQWASWHEGCYYSLFSHGPLSIGIRYSQLRQGPHHSHPLSRHSLRLSITTALTVRYAVCGTAARRIPAASYRHSILSPPLLLQPPIRHLPLLQVLITSIAAVLSCLIVFSAMIVPEEQQCTLRDLSASIHSIKKREVGVRCLVPHKFKLWYLVAQRLQAMEGQMASALILTECSE